LPAMLLAAIATAFGLQVARRFAFPILFLYFAIPAVEHLQFVFQEITVVAVHLMIRAVDISAFVERNLVYVPAGTFAIESGCSGLNFVVSGLSLATLYGHLYYHRRRDTLRLAVLVLVISMIGNWIRVFAIVVIGYHFGMDNSIVTDHLWLGWVIFAILMVPIFIVARRWESVAPGVEAERTTSAPLREPGPVSVPAAAAAILALSVGPAWAGIAAPTDREFQTLDLQLPEDISGWRGPLPTVWNWQPSYIGATSERVAEYVRGERVVLAYTNVYLSQEQGRELIFFSNKVTGNWRRSRTAVVPAKVNIPDAGWFEQTVAESVYGPWVIVYRNVIGGEPVLGELQSKLRQSVATLRGRPEAGVVAFASPCAGSCDEAMAALSEFITAAGDDATVNFEIED